MVAAGIQKQSVWLFFCGKRDGSCHPLGGREFLTACLVEILGYLAGSIARFPPRPKHGSMDEPGIIPQYRTCDADCFGVEIDDVKRDRLLPVPFYEFELRLQFRQKILIRAERGFCTFTNCD